MESDGFCREAGGQGSEEKWGNGGKEESLTGHDPRSGLEKAKAGGFRRNRVGGEVCKWDRSSGEECLLCGDGVEFRYLRLRSGTKAYRQKRRCGLYNTSLRNVWLSTVG